MWIRWFTLSLLLCLGCRMPSQMGQIDVAASLPSPPSLAGQRTASSGRVMPAAFEDRPPADCLDMAAACIERGDTPGAIEQFNRHLRQFPEQIMIRAYLAELLLKVNKLPDAQDQYERFVAAAQLSDGAPRQHVVHCHTRLMEIAQNREDDYGEHLHRGIGMVLLARQLEASGVGNDAEAGFRERLLCKAANELTKAKNIRPDEPRPHWYLVEVWSKLNQSRSAQKALQRARQCAALLPLPPAENRALVLASTH